MPTIQIRKVDEPYGWLGNMSNHRITYDGKIFKTSEHLFQWKRFEGYPEIQEILFEQASPMGVKMKTKKYRNMLIKEGKWDHDEEKDVNWMRECLRLKINQHPELMRKLKLSHPHWIVEDCTKRPRGSGLFWGAALENGEWVGHNILGQLWMKIRDELLNE
jgi:ribA/ribD-fused uncharacterized protein